jgi:hypothetical protein
MVNGDLSAGRGLRACHCHDEPWSSAGNARVHRWFAKIPKAISITKTTNLSLVARCSLQGRAFDKNIDRVEGSRHGRARWH